MAYESASGAKYKRLKKYEDADKNKEKEKAMLHKGKQEKELFTRQLEMLWYAEMQNSVL